jgi:DmX-like protein
VCRIWSETITSEDCLTYSIQEDSESTCMYTIAANKSSRQKRKLFFNKIQKMSFKQQQQQQQQQSLMVNSTINQIPSESKLTANLSCNELSQKNFSFCNLTHTRLNFHLAGFIDIDNGSTFNLNNDLTKHFQFNVHWLNNKNLNFTLASEAFFQEIKRNLSNSSDSININNNNNNEQLVNSNNNNNETNDQDDHDLISNENRNNIETGLIYETSKNLLLTQQQDQRLDKIIKDWYSSQDLLYCINPVDGSILIWMIDWLDEHMPGTYRQPQVSFHAKLPNTMPVGDAFSLTNSIFLFTQKIKKSNNKTTSGYDFANILVNMVSKHSNGTLNQWRLQFQENTKFQSLVNVTHLSRVCGHRFRVSDISSHPILPFLLTNSINDTKSNSVNITNNNNNSNKDFEPDSSLLEKSMIEKNENFFKNNTLNENQRDLLQKMKKRKLKEKFQKGLIIWGVEPVGPLSISGGIYELARVDSCKENAFENIAWFPCFLPSFTLGTASSSPSTLFVSSDSSCITIYQAVFDARTLLHDLKQKNMQQKGGIDYKKGVSTSSSMFSITTDIPYDNFNVISIQSTARPGCIIELDKLVDSNENWSKADLFHVYQEDLIKNLNKTTTTTAGGGVGSKSNKYQNTTDNYFKRRDP